MRRTKSMSTKRFKRALKKRISLNVKVDKLAKYVHKNAPEVKYIELNTFGTYSMTSTGLSSRLTNMPSQAVADNGGRIGDSINVRYIECTGYLKGIEATLATATRIPNCIARVIFGIFKQPSAQGVPLISGATTSVLDTTAATAVFAPYNKDFRSNWTLLKDYKCQLSNFYGTDSIVGPHIGNREHIKLFKHRFAINKVMKFASNTGADTSVNTMLPFVLIMSDRSAAEVFFPSITMYSRMYYTDA